MDIGFGRLGASVLILGSVVFLIAAFAPISRVFVEPTAERKLALILASPGTWTTMQVLFGLGTVIAAVGVTLIGHHLRGAGLAAHAYVSAGLMLTGSLLWARHLYLRTIDPAMFAEGLIPLWLFAVYSLLTMVGLALFGWVLLQTPVPGWVGWMLIGSMAFFFIMAIIFGDMPPFVYYVVAIIAGVMILRAGPL